MNQPVPLTPDQFLQVIYAQLKADSDKVIACIDAHFEYLVFHEAMIDLNPVLREIDINLVPPYALLHILRTLRPFRFNLPAFVIYEQRISMLLHKKFPRFANKWLESDNE